MSDLVKRLRALRVLDEVGSDNPLGREAADQLERYKAFVEKVRGANQHLDYMAIDQALADLDKGTP